MTAQGNAVSPTGWLATGTRKRVVTDLVTVKVSAEETSDAVTVLEVETPPGGGMPPHVQRYEDESIHVVEGTYMVAIGDSKENVTAGDVRYIRRGVRHAYVNPGPGPARMMVHLSPGGIQEQFIAEIGDAPERPIWESDLQRIVSLAPAFGIEFEIEDD